VAAGITRPGYREPQEPGHRIEMRSPFYVPFGQ
jgi:hypothetical protein